MHNGEVILITITFNGNFPSTYDEEPISFSKYNVPSPLTRKYNEPIGELSDFYVGEAYTNPGGEGYHIIPDQVSNIAWKFSGWYTAKNGGIKIIDSTFFTEDTTIHAHWAKNAYKVIWNAMGGSSVLSCYKLPNAEIGMLPVSTKPNYTLDGWFTDASDGI